MPYWERWGLQFCLTIQDFVAPRDRARRVGHPGPHENRFWTHQHNYHSPLQQHDRRGCLAYYFLSTSSFGRGLWEYGIDSCFEIYCERKVRCKLRGPLLPPATEPLCAPYEPVLIAHCDVRNGDPASLDRASKTLASSAINYGLPR